MDGRIQPLHQLLVSLAESIEILGLFSKYIQDGVGGFAGIKYGGKGMCM